MSITPTTTVRNALVVNPLHGTGFVLLGRGDINQLSLLDKARACDTKVVIYKTRPFDGTDEAQRSRKKRAKRIRVFGDGTVSDGYMIVGADNARFEYYPILQSLGFSGQNILIYQECSERMIGRQLDVALIMNYSGRTLDVMMDYLVLD